MLLTPKDMYVMPIANMLVDSIANNELLSFMDGFSGYNQILIVVEDIPKTVFRCLGFIGTFEWLVMLFGLKNAGATPKPVTSFRLLTPRTVDLRGTRCRHP